MTDTGNEIVKSAIAAVHKVWNDLPIGWQLRPIQVSFDFILAAEQLARFAEGRSDDGEKIDTDWLVSIGFEVIIHNPSIETRVLNQLLEWRYVGFYIENTPIMLANSRGHARRLFAALGIETKESK